MTTALKKARAKLMRRPVGLTIAWVILEETGERIEGLVPSFPIDRRSLKERKFGVGTQLRGELRRDRNPGFWRKAHVLGGWLADNVEAFHGLSLHDALKRLQEKSGIGCESRPLNLPELGITGTVMTPVSLNFSDLDEGEFQVLWDGWIEWLRKNAWPHLPPQAREEVEDLISRDQQ